MDCVFRWATDRCWRHWFNFVTVCYTVSSKFISLLFSSYRMSLMLWSGNSTDKQWLQVHWLTLKTGLIISVLLSRHFVCVESRHTWQSYLEFLRTDFSQKLQLRCCSGRWFVSISPDRASWNFTKWLEYNEIGDSIFSSVVLLFSWCSARILWDFPIKSACCRSVHDSLRLKLHTSVQQPLVIQWAPKLSLCSPFLRLLT